MTDKVYLYPKTSCPCDSCSPYKPSTDGIKSNFGVRGCKESPYFDCNDFVETKRNLVPLEDKGFTLLNPGVYNDKLAEGFDKKECPCDKGPLYVSNDPRQFDAARWDFIPLDGVPINGDVRLKNIYNSNLDIYRDKYNSYENIKDGQILYYTDASIANAFYKPVFSEPAQEISGLFRDPMGAMKPEYNRQPIFNTENPMITRQKNNPYCLSSLGDSQTFREDIMSYQQRKNNQQKWSARWSNMDM